MNRVHHNKRWGRVSTGCCPNPLTKSFKIDIMGKTQRRITVPAMMSYQDPPQRKLFYMGINLDKRIRKDHPLRKIRELIDFDFIYKEVKDKYGYNGNESVPPPVILKLMLQLVLYNVRSERELMDTL